MKNAQSLAKVAIPRPVNLIWFAHLLNIALRNILTPKTTHLASIISPAINFPIFFFFILTIKKITLHLSTLSDNNYHL